MIAQVSKGKYSKYTAYVDVTSCFENKVPMYTILMGAVSMEFLTKYQLHEI